MACRVLLRSGATVEVLSSLSLPKGTVQIVFSRSDVEDATGEVHSITGKPPLKGESTDDAMTVRAMFSELLSSGNTTVSTVENLLKVSSVATFASQHRMEETLNGILEAAGIAEAQEKSQIVEMNTRLTDIQSKMEKLVKESNGNSDSESEDDNNGSGKGGDNKGYGPFGLIGWGVAKGVKILTHMWGNGGV
ncbi:unnamed protein product [Linum trigynum]|uniref:Uncharacterized protein n=1 Tax=Linum trigynum TaxID=586398 RepID=A0AAV2FF34_9ROSI